jgi:hypothetical protein
LAKPILTKSSTTPGIVVLDKPVILARADFVKPASPSDKNKSITLIFGDKPNMCTKLFTQPHLSSNIINQFYYINVTKKKQQEL